MRWHISVRQKQSSIGFTEKMRQYTCYYVNNTIMLQPKTGFARGQPTTLTMAQEYFTKIHRNWNNLS